jgi:hypothetical protein
MHITTHRRASGPDSTYWIGAWGRAANVHFIYILFHSILQAIVSEDMKIKHGQLPNIRKPSTNINKQTNIYRNSEIMPHHSDKFKCKKKKKKTARPRLSKESH